MKKLFVIDSDKNFQTLVKGLCDDRKVDVHFFQKGKKIEKSAEKEMPDLFILNLELEDINGFIVCNNLRKNNTLSGIPLLITSSEKSERDFEQHRKLKFKADGYYRKPLSKDDLKTVLMEFLCDDCLVNEKQESLNNEFTEENIDKLLESTFMEFGSTPPKKKEKKVEQMAKEPVVEIEDDVLDLDVPSVSEDDLEDDSEENIDMASVKEDVKPEPVPEVKRKPGTSFDESGFAFIAPGSEDEEIAPVEELTAEEIQDVEPPEVEDEIPLLIEESEVEAEEDMPEIIEDIIPEKEEVQGPTELEEKQTADISKLKNENQDLSVQVISLEKQNEFLRNENKNLLVNIKGLQADVAERVEEETRITQELQEKFDSMEKELSKVKTSEDDMKKQQASLAEELGKAKEQKEQAMSHLSERNKEIDELTESNQGLSNELEKLITSMDDLRKLMEEKENRHSEELRYLEEKKIQETEKMFESNSQKISELENKVSELENEKKSLQLEMIEEGDAHKKNLTEMEIQKNNIEAELEAAKSKTDRCEEDIRQLEEKVIMLEESNAGLVKEREDKENMLLNTIENLKHNLKESEESEKRLKSKLSSLSELFSGARNVLEEGDET